MAGRWGAIFLGSVVAVAMQLLLVTLGLGLGLVLLPVKSGTSGEFLGIGIAAAAFLGFSLVLSYGIGGFIASRLFPSEKKEEAFAQGLGVWGTIFTTALIVIGVSALPTLSQTLGFAGAGAGALSLVEELRKAEPRIITDVKLTEGRIVTRLALNPTSSASQSDDPRSTARRGESQNAPTEEALKSAATTATAVAGVLGLALFFGLLLSAAGSLTGAWLGRGAEKRRFLSPLRQTSGAAA